MRDDEQAIPLLKLVPIPSLLIDEVPILFDMEVKRLSSVDNLADVANVYASSWKDAYRGIIDQAYLDTLQGGEWTASLEAGKDHTWIARIADETVGVCTYGSARDEAHAGWGEIVSLYVLPERMGIGIGTKLLDVALGSLHDEGFEQMYLWVLDENANARRFYEQLGFELDGCECFVEIAGKQLREVSYAKRNKLD